MTPPMSNQLIEDVAVAGRGVAVGVGVRAGVDTGVGTGAGVSAGAGAGAGTVGGGIITVNFAVSRFSSSSSTSTS